MSKLIHIKSSDRTSGDINNSFFDIPSGFISCKSNEQLNISLVNFFVKEIFIIYNRIIIHSM